MVRWMVGRAFGL